MSTSPSRRSATWLVAALGDEGGAEIAAAGMHGDHHVGGTAGERLVGHAGVFRGQAVGIVAALRWSNSRSFGSQIIDQAVSSSCR